MAAFDLIRAINEKKLICYHDVSLIENSLKSRVPTQSTHVIFVKSECGRQST